MFGAEPCRSTLAAAQRTGLWLDALAFIPAYTAFLALAARALGGRAAWPLIGMFVTAGLLDEIEGVLLWRVLATLPGTQPVLDALFWAVRGKFLLLGLGTFALGALLTLRFNRVALPFGLVIAAGGLQALLRFFALPSPGMMGGFTVGWLALFVAAATASLWPSPFAPARAFRPPAPASPSV